MLRGTPTEDHGNKIKHRSIPQVARTRDADPEIRLADQRTTRTVLPGRRTPLPASGITRPVRRPQRHSADSWSRSRDPRLACSAPSSTLDATTPVEERAAIALVVEVTSPTSPDTVLNDRTTKPVQYARAGVPLYLLVDQELGRWTLFGLAEGWERYQVAADGAYGEEISLPAPLNFSLTSASWPRWK
jgi:hypothetical protein